MLSPPSQEISEALVATKLFIAALEKENLSDWAVRFSEIAQCLARNDIKAAVSKYSACSYTGPGSLSDIFASDESNFNKCWGECGKALRALKKHT